jgi:hypothetical protein
MGFARRGMACQPRNEWARAERTNLKRRGFYQNKKSVLLCSDQSQRFKAKTEEGRRCINSQENLEGTGEGK